MKHTIVKLFLFIIALSTFSTSVLSQINPNPNAAVDAFIQNEMNIQHLPGVSAVIVKDNKIVWINSYGYADVANAIPVQDTTVFLLASVSKIFTGTAAMQLYENNIIGLDDDVNQYLPWQLQIPGFPNDSITFRQLMTHTSSIQDNWTAIVGYYGYPDPTITLADCMQRYFSTNGSDYNAVANFLALAPGSVFAYSNMATALNGYLTELVSGMSFDQYCNANIFSKLCMNKTAWHFSDFNLNDVAVPYHFSNGDYIAYPQYGFADYPDGQLRSNVTDLANFMIAYLNGGSLGSNSILSQASISQMWTVQFPLLQPNMGLNWYKQILYYNGGSSWVWGHNGGASGVSTNMYLDPVNNIGLCVLSNGEGTGINICDELYNYALSLNSATGFSPACLTTGVDDLQPAKQKKLIKIIDLLGRETQLKTNTPLIKIFSDGSAEKFFILD